jgi:2-dehydro-3-deoxygluconokinase
MKQFPKCKTVAFTFRFDEAGGIRYFGTMHKKDFHYSSPEFRTDQIIDRVGSGDCFMAGLIFGLSQSWPGQQVIDFSAAAAFGKLGERGDFTRQTKESIFSSLEKFRE